MPTGARRTSTPGAADDDDDDAQFVYNRVSAHDSEDDEPGGTAPNQGQRHPHRQPAPGPSGPNPGQPPASQQARSDATSAAAATGSSGGSSSSAQAQVASLAPSTAAAGAGVDLADLLDLWPPNEPAAATASPAAAAASAGAVAGAPAGAAAAPSPLQRGSSSSWAVWPEPGGGASSAAAGVPEARAAAGAGAGGAKGPQLTGDGGGGESPPAAASEADAEAGDAEGCGHTEQKRELLIFAVPLQRGKVVFMPVSYYREAPEDPGSGIASAVNDHLNKVQGEASDLWSRMAQAEAGTLGNRIYRLGKRVLEGIPAEERLMRGIPKKIEKVIIYHPSQLDPEAIQEQMHTMTKSYALKAVGKAAAATVMLPIAMGIDLIILPGPQVLTYYTAWELYRNTNGALGTQRMARFVTQGGSSSTIRVNYMVDTRLDRYWDAALDSPDGVLSEEDVEALVADVREADLLTPLQELRAQALRTSTRKQSDYVALGDGDTPSAGTGGGSGFLGAVFGSRSRSR